MLMFFSCQIWNVANKVNKETSWVFDELTQESWENFIQSEWLTIQGAGLLMMDKTNNNSKEGQQYRLLEQFLSAKRLCEGQDYMVTLKMPFIMQRYWIPTWWTIRLTNKKASNDAWAEQIFCRISWDGYMEHFFNEFTGVT